MRKMLAILFSCLVISPVFQTVAAEASSTLLVIPARFTLVKLGLHMVKMRQVELVSYEQPSKGPLELYNWNTGSGKWKPISLEEYSTGTFTPSPITSIVIIGDEKSFPESIHDASSWGKRLEKIQTLNLAALLNKFDHIFRFSAAEWRALASNYGVTIEDLNAERRRYGRFGKPGQEKTPPSAKIEQTDPDKQSSVTSAAPAAQENGTTPEESPENPDMLTKTPMQEAGETPAQQVQDEPAVATGESEPLENPEDK